MAGNAFGEIFRLTTFGESHGKAIGGILEGCPAGLEIDLDFISDELSRRRPGQSHISTTRDEQDQVEFLSGIFEGKTTGTPIGFSIANKDHRSGDYDKVKDAFRPSHADFTYTHKYGLRDHRGGGRSSARETACRVVAGAIAKLFLSKYGVAIHAFVKQVGPVVLNRNFDEVPLENTESSIVRCPDDAISKKMIAYIEEVRSQGDTVGGIIQCVALNVPIGLGEPVFNKLHAVLGHAMLSINAVKGFEIGSGFSGTALKGSEHNDSFVPCSGSSLPVTSTNHSGGVQGGISNGMPVYFNVAFKPVATIAREQDTVNNKGEKTTLKVEGRHDPCVVPRAVPIVESMTALVLADFMLQNRCSRL